MITTVIEALENSKVNFENVGRMGAAKNPLYMIAMQQLNNALEALENVNNPDYVIQEHMFDDVNTGS